MRSRTVLLLLAALASAALIAGCGASEPSASSASGSPSSGQPSPQAPGRPSAVTLLDAGSEPRQRLRLRPQAGDVQRYLISTKMSSTSTIDGQPAPLGEIPEVVIGTRVEIEDVQSDGVIRSSFVYDDVKVAGSGPQVDQMADILEENLVGVRGRLEVYDTGEFIDGSLDPPAGIDPLLRKTLRSYESELRNLSAPLPFEEVGVGAVWTYETRSAVNDVEVDTTYRFELVEISGDQVVLETTSTGDAPQQKVQLPGVPGGVDVRLKRMSLSGRGSTTLDLTQLVPIAMGNAVFGDVVMIFKEGGSTSELLQLLKIRTAIEPG